MEIMLLSYLSEIFTQVLEMVLWLFGLSLFLVDLNLLL